MENFDHEKVFKVLQSMRANKPIIAVCADLPCSFSLEQAVRAIGFRTIFPPAKGDGQFSLPQNITSLLDFSFVISKSPSQYRDILRAFKKQPFKVLSIGKEITYVPQNGIKLLKGCLRTRPDVIVCDDSIAHDTLLKVIDDANRVFFLKYDYKPIILRTSVARDLLTDGDASLIVHGNDNPIHNIVCDTLMIGSFVSAAIESCEDCHFSAFSAALFLRASSRRALSVTNGPGSFYPVFIDSLYHLKRDYIYQVKFESFYNNDASFKVSREVEAA